MKISGLKEKFNNTIKILERKKILTIITILLLITIIAFTANIRTNNIDKLKDVTTGEYLTADLDAFYFLRLAEVLHENGSYSEYDSMRYPLLKLSFSNELLPYTIVFLYKVIKPLSADITIRYVDVIYPVIFFVLGMLVFFFLILHLTKSRMVALLSSFFLAIIPSYLFRTMAGVSDHEPLGMFAFFLALLVFSISMEKIEKKNSWKMAIILGIITGFFTIFSIAAWSGIASFVLLIIPLTVFLLWVTNKMNSEEGKNNLREYLLFYGFWIIAFISLGFIFSYPITAIKSFIFNMRGLIIPLVFVFILTDYILINIKHKKIEKLGKKRIWVSLILTLFISIIIALIFNLNLGFSLSDIVSSVLRPFGGGRTGSTVAENALPYTVDIIRQIGAALFWIFFLGVIFVGIEFSKGIGKKKNRIIFSLLWVFMMSGILFHRYSTTALFNGNSFLSKLFYIGGMLLFFGYFVWIYFKDNIKIKGNQIIILLYVFFMTLSGISAVRLLFIFTPVVCFISAYSLKKIYDYADNSKDEIVKVILYAVLIGIIILLVFTSVAYIKSIKVQSSQIGSSANEQWQHSMKWVRENTEPNDVFVHWWDYGYWVQYMGERPTITDGGHGNGYWDHLIGRYLLTTPYPETALSFMKAQNVSYLLIDPTDIGKYSAYSSIGSNVKGDDRFSFIPTMISSKSQMQETKNGIIRVYQGGYGLDGDILYEEDDKKIFLPMENSGIAGVIVEKENGKFKQPIVAYVYNGNQVNIPMRYLYYNGTIYDFKNGTNSGIYIIPQISQVNNALQLDEEGALIYLSPKVIDSLVAQVYLMNDPLKRYNNSLKLEHSEPDPLKTYLEMYSTMKINEFFYLGGIRGPLKIWSVHPSERIIAREEFTKVSGEYAELDNLTFIR